MFIVNQKRTEVVNVNNLIEIQFDDNVIWGVSNVGKIPLGDYENAEEARKVFEKMLKVVFPTNAWILKDVDSNLVNLKINDDLPLNIITKGDAEITRYDIGVWYMPE